MDSVAATRPGVLSARTGVALLGALAVMPADEEVREFFRGDLQQDAFLGRTATVVETFGGAAAPLLMGGAWIIASSLGAETLSDISRNALESIVVAAAFTYAGKTLAGRERPTDREDGQWSYSPGRGFRDPHYRAFPSGHSTQAFALAAALSGELQRHQVRGARLFTPLLYTSATLTGLSRIYHDRHWASDVALGAVVGTLAAQAVGRRHEASETYAPLVRVGSGTVFLGLTVSPR